MKLACFSFVLCLALAITYTVSATPAFVPPPSETHAPAFDRTAVPIAGPQPVVAVTVLENGAPVKTGSGVLHVKIIGNAIIENYVFTARDLVENVTDILVSFVDGADSNVQWPLTNAGWIGETVSAAFVVWRDDTIACLRLSRALGVNGAVWRAERVAAFSGENMFIHAHVHVFGNGKVNITGPHRVSLTSDTDNRFGEVFLGAGVFDHGNNCIGLIVRLDGQQVVRFPAGYVNW